MYYREYCYMPLLFLLNQQPVLVRMRSAGRDAAAGVEEDPGWLFDGLREAWPATQIILRTDSRFCREPILAAYERRERVDYLLSVAKNRRLEREIATEMDHRFIVTSLPATKRRLLDRIGSELGIVPAERSEIERKSFADYRGQLAAHGLNHPDSERPPVSAGNCSIPEGELLLGSVRIPDAKQMMSKSRSRSPEGGETMEDRRIQPEDLVPALVSACTTAGRTLSEFERTLAPAAEALSNTLRQVSAVIRPVLPYFVAFARFSRIVDAIGGTGWVPHRSVPLKQIEALIDDVPRLDEYFASYYEQHWTDVRQDIVSRLDGYHVDDETRDTIREAFEAHEYGHYRCVCRVLFPEVERSIRSRFNVVEVGRSLSKRKITDVFNGTTLGEVINGDPLSYRRFRLLVQHVYERLDSTSVQKIKDVSTPNRHAALHGLVTYSTKKHSINMILMADFMLEFFSSIDPARVHGAIYPTSGGARNRNG